MQVTVAGMENVGNAQLILRSYLISSIQYLRQTRARHNRILNHRVRRNATDGAKGSLASGPQFFSFVLVAREATVASAMLQTDGLDPLRFLVETRVESIQFD